MKKVKFRPRAWEDVQESVLYLATEASGEIAEQFLDAVIELTETLAKWPRMGAPYESVNPRLRGLRRLSVTGFERWLVFY